MEAYKFQASHKKIHLVLKIYSISWIKQTLTELLMPQLPMIPVLDHMPFVKFMSKKINKLLGS